MKCLYLMLGTVLCCSAVIREAHAAVAWNGGAGDRDLANAANWSGEALPASSEEAQLGTASTEAAPLTLATAATLQPYDIRITANQWLDLGVGHAFTALHRVYFNTNAKLVLTSGTFGVDWDSTSGERFFMGDTTVANGAITVTGSDAVLSSSKNNNLQVGVNAAGFHLTVKDGATLKANVSVGQSNWNSKDNVVWIEGAGTRHWVPASGGIAALAVSPSSANSTYVLTNQAMLKVESGKNIEVGSYYQNCVQGVGHMRVMDRATVESNGGMYVGPYGNSNDLVVAGGSQVGVNDFVVGNNPWEKTNLGNAKVGPSRENLALFTDADTSLVASNRIVCGYVRSCNNTLQFADGARVAAVDTYCGYNLATNNVMYFGTDVVMVAQKDFSAGNLGYWRSANNRLVVDGARVYCTNGTANTTVGAVNGYSNRFEIVNGGSLCMTTPGGLFLAGSGGTGVNENKGYATNCTVLVQGADSHANFYDSWIVVGVEKDCFGNAFRIDGATVAITNVTSDSKKNCLYVGYNGSDNVLEVTNGGVLDMTNVTFAVGQNAGAASNRLVVSHGARMHLMAKEIKQNFIVGNYGMANGMEVGDGARVEMPMHILRPGYQAPSSNSWLHVTGGATVDVYRVIMGELAAHCSIVVSNAALIARTGTMQLGGARSESYGHTVEIRGENAYLSSFDGTLLAADSVMTFVVDKGGFKNSPVVNAQGGFAATSNCTAEHPATVRIEVADGNLDGGTYTLIKTNAGKLNWTNLNLEYDSRRVRIVEKSATRLVVRVSDTHGTVYLVR